MSAKLEGKIAVVTGAGSGIGRGIARALASEGAAVVVADVDLEAAETVVAELVGGGAEAVATRCDVTDRGAVEAMAELAWGTFGRVDLVFNNAGIVGEPAPCIEIDETAARAILDVNLVGVWHGCAVFGPRLIAQGGPAHIVNTASENGLAAPVLGRAFYTASKHAVLGLSDVLRQELPDPIVVSVLCPGIVASKMTGMDGEENPPVGLGADEVGRRAVAGALAGEFYIVTHAPVAQYVEERATEIAAAFERQAPRFDGDGYLDTRALLKGMTE
ncbi:MAG: SDR family NAD(P)-dependent oxidoreductase [Acidimicrobiales bacterium]